MMLQPMPMPMPMPMPTAETAAPRVPGGSTIFEANLREHRRLFESMEALAVPVHAAAQAMTQCLRRGGRLLFLGNGGSAADSQHLAAEFAGRLRRERAPLAALALSADAVTLTALANDYGYEAVFARQLEAQARPGDCVVAISTSGRSPNVLRALEAAQRLGLARIALLGRDGGAARALAEHAVVVPHEDSGRIQEAHIFIGHTWCGLVERALGLVA